MANAYYNITGSAATLILAKSISKRTGALSTRTPAKPDELIIGSGYSENEYARKRSKAYKIHNMYLTNVHTTDSVTINIYVYRTTINQSNNPATTKDGDGTYNVVADTYNTYYIIKNLVIPKGVTLKLDKEDMEYDHENLDLYIKLSASDSAVDIIIK